MDIRQVESYILLNYGSPIVFIHGPMKRNFLNAGLLSSFITLLILGVGFALGGYIRPWIVGLWSFIVLALIMAFVALLQLKLTKRSIMHNNFENTAPRGVRNLVFIGSLSGLLGVLAIRVLGQLFPEGTFLIFLVVFIIGGLMSFSSACRSFQKAFLIGKYCPYLILPKDNRIFVNGVFGVIRTGVPWRDLRTRVQKI